jgi:probable F420-dependent oxidoreductase
MKIGLQPPNSGPHATPEFMTELAELGDQLGYDSLQVTDHILVPSQVNSRYPYNATGVFASRPETDYYEPISLLAYLIGRTRRIRLGTSVLILPYRNPLLVAKQLACMDRLSGGRMVLGVGVGWMEEEFRILDAPSFAERGAVTDEYIEGFRRIWREGTTTLEGRYIHTPEIGVNPRPAQAGGIPIIVGGVRRPAIRRAARLGDGWQPFKLPPDELITGLNYLRAQARRSGRDLRGFTVSLRLGLRMTREPTERRPEEEPWKTLVGPARDVLQHLRTYRDLGVTEVVFDFRTCRPDEMRETIQLCAEQIVPAFAE